MPAAVPGMAGLPRPPEGGAAPAPEGSPAEQGHRGAPDAELLAIHGQGSVRRRRRGGEETGRNEALMVV